MNPKFRSGESAQGESRLADELCKVISKAQSLYIKQRFARGTQRNITNFLRLSRMTRDSIKIFSLTFCTVLNVYCTWKIAKDVSESALLYNFLHSVLPRENELLVLRCSSFCFKTMICLRLYLLCTWDVQCCMLRFVLWINKLKCSLKPSSVSLVLATEHL